VPTTHIESTLAPQRRPLAELPHNFPTPLNVTCRVIPPSLSIHPDPIFIRREVGGKGGWKIVPFDLTLLDCLFHSPAFVVQNHWKKLPILLASKIVLTRSLEDVSKEEAGFWILRETGRQGVSQVPQLGERCGILAVGPDHFLFRYSK
jgi:hypothetical protein